MISKSSSIYSNDHYDSLSSSIDNITIASRTQLSYLFSLDFIQSSANFIYPNVRIISSGYFSNQTNKNSIYIFSNTLSSTKNIPLIFLVDLFLNRSQFIQEIPQLDNLSDYLYLPQSISALVFFDSLLTPSLRHQCYELRTKENKNKFTIKDLFVMAQRENNIIQINALNDKRYHAFKDQLTDIYYSNKITKINSHTFI
ncbi:unnamed protein product [Adineta steineri]|uniref:Uncharacterized protein n=1 Tax=Adineta steineri TaxID=433720 RepID=A0A819J8J6_9BILA|nr:unnamed protein product [Adineta steineri]